MKLNSLLNPLPLLVEIGPDSLRARQGVAGVELLLERAPDGRLTAAGKAKAIAALRNFVKPKAWLPRPRAWCAIGSRGVSLRRLSLPAGSPEEFQQRLLLQIEAEFPLPPEELAWGCQPLGEPRPANGGPARQDLLVAAVKKELVADYHEILRACGTDPVFVLAAMARWNFCGQRADSFAMVDAGPRQSELTIFANAVPTFSRIFFADAQSGSPPADPELEALAQSIRESRVARVFVSGNGVARDFTERLARSLGGACRCDPLEAEPTDGNSAAISGLEKFTTANNAPALLIQMQPASGTQTSWATLDWKKWGTRVGLLAAAALLLPYAEALFLKPHLEKKVAAFKNEAGRLQVIDRELDFLQDLKLSQPPCLDVLYVLSKSVPPGTRFDSLSLNSHGEVSLRAAFHDGQQVADFRGKLIASGFFTNVVVEEQVPTPDHQKVNIRMSALEKNATQMQQASARLTSEDAAKDAKAAPPGVPGVAPVLRKEPK